MNLPLIEEVTKRAQKAKAGNQAGMFTEKIIVRLLESGSLKFKFHLAA